MTQHLLAAIQFPTWIRPEALQFGSVTIRWYGLMYILGFIIGYFLLTHLCQKKYLRMPADWVADFLIYLFAGMLLGARLFYMVFYFRPSPEEPLTLATPFQVWHGGLSFHGGAVGMFIAIFVFAKRHKVRFWNLADSLVLAASPGLFFGRIGNFINAELYGRATDLPWGVSFPERDAYGQIVQYTEPRHPSQLYEAVGEGALLFLILWFILRKRIPYQGVIAGIGLAGYALVRFGIEFLREPDQQLGFIFGGLTMGQLLCVAMFVVAASIAVWNYRRRVLATEPGETGLRMDAGDFDHQPR